ncbi:MAG: amidohydrolase family protein [Clostridiales bacterium]|nr:amidohydrolase family protein [Clostridiales bacterium]
MENSRKKADYLFTGGQVITVNSNNETAEAAAVAEDRILFVGRDKEARAYVDEHTKIIDICGKALTPGFIDTHIHVCHTGAIGTAIIDVDPKEAGSIDEIKEKIRAAAAIKPEGSWISLWGYDEERLKDRRHPTREDLDEAAPGHLVQLCRYCGHAGVFNTMALKTAGISMDTMGRFPAGQVISENGELTGLLHETAYYHMWQLVELPEEDLLAALKAENDRLIEAGVTTVHDAGAYGSKSNRAALRAAGKGLLDVRVFPMMFSLLGKAKVKENIYSYINTGLGAHFGNEKVKFGLMKIMLDGSSSGPSCAVREPYCHNSGTGLLDWDQDEINEIVLAIHKAGLQATAHAVGDRAIDMWLNAVENAQMQYPREDARHRIEHCGICPPDLVKRIKDLDMIPTANSAFIGLFGERYLKFYGERTGDLFPCASFLDAGIKSCIATDCSIVPENPMIGLYEAVTRKSDGGLLVGKNQRIGIRDAIRMYTYNPAYAGFCEDELGSIEAGKIADLALWSGWILGAAPEKLLENKCLMTMIGGEIVYQKPGFAL